MSPADELEDYSRQKNQLPRAEAAPEIKYDAMTGAGASAGANAGAGAGAGVCADAVAGAGASAVAAADTDARVGVVKALCLHAAHDCNLRCRYCFAGAGVFGGNRGLMSIETGKKALDFLFDASGARRHVEVDYFGGEPLLNFAVIRELILYGQAESARRGKVLKQTLTTNGLLLEGDVLDFLNEHDIALVLSLDGRREINDLMRPCLDGAGSYDRILPRLRTAVEDRGGDNYYVRGTYTRHNRDFFQDVLHLTECGFDLVSVEPAVASEKADFALRPDDLPELFEQYEKLARYCHERHIAGKPLTFFHFNLDLDFGPCLPKRLQGCGAGSDYLAVTPEGDLYPCHQFVGQKEFIIGHVDSGIITREISERFRNCHILTKELCRTCWARFFCGGGCHANAWNHSQDLQKPYELGCALEKKRLECALWLKVKQSPS